MTVIADDMFMLKAVALLHDPPHKAFVLIKHEEKAKDLARKIFGDAFVASLNDERVRSADRLASSFDRWILAMFFEAGYVSAFIPKRIKLKNIVAPWLDVDYERHSGREWDSEVSAYGEELGASVGEVQDWRWKYHLLYALYEPLWISRNLPLSPADTRTPTHSTFDHNYATAAIVNWFLESKETLKGLMVGIDVAGVQEFIMSSRKLRDMWASSYIVSALTWYTIIELVEALGPDIVVMPSLRFNPFYMYWLSNKVEGRGQKARDALGKAEKIAYLNVEEVRETRDELGIPPYPVIPERATLILPSWDAVKELLAPSEGVSVGSVEKYLEERFKKGWRVLWNALRKLAEIRAQEYRGVWRIVNSIFKYYYERDIFKGAGFHETPPLTLRISSVTVDKPIFKEGGIWKAYDEIYKELTSKMALSKYRGRSPATSLDLKTLTLRAFEENVELGTPERSKRGFEYCTSCGSMPAILVLPRDESRFNDAVRELAGYIIEDYEIAAFKVAFKPGEKLCPWCFVKRVISLEPRLLKVLLLGFTEDEVNDPSKLEKIVGARQAPFGFPSLSHMASARLYEKLVDILGGQAKIPVEEVIMKGMYVCVEGREAIAGAKAIERRWFMRRLGKKVNEWIKELERRGEGQDLIFSLIYSVDPEYLWFHEKCRRDWERLLGGVNVDGIPLVEWLWRYYALVKADGDSIGRLLDGDFRAFAPGLKNESELKDFIESYIIDSAEGPYKEVIKVCARLARENVARLEERREFNELAKRIVLEVPRINVDDAKQRIRDVVRALSEVFELGRIPVTPSYHVSISSALMRAALADMALASRLDGFIVYAGGDDLLAFAPVDKALKLAINTRLSFAGARSEVDAGLTFEGGFLKLSEAHLPMLASVGRSYVVYIAHYYYPLSIVISRATELLDEAKEKVSFEYLNERFKVRSSMKDMLVVAYNPRGPERVALIPLSYTRPLRFNAEGLNGEIASLARLALRLACYSDRRIGLECENELLSHSFYYDFHRREMIELLEGLVGELRRGNSMALEAMRSLVMMLLKRNVKRARSEEDAVRIYAEVFEPIIPSRVPRPIIGSGWLEEFEHARRLMVSNIVRAALLTLSGMR